MTAAEDIGLPAEQVLLTRFDRVGDAAAVGLEAAVEHVVVVAAHAPLARGGIERPRGQRIEDGTAVGGKRQGHPLVVAETVAGEIAPTVAAVDDGLLAAAAQGDEETGLGYVGVVGLAAAHDLHVVNGAVGAADVVGHEPIGVGTVPAVDVGGAHVVSAAVLEHAVALAARTVEDLCAVK